MFWHTFLMIMTWEFWFRQAYIILHFDFTLIFLYKLEQYSKEESVF